jgi:Protein of unknown function (DUF3800)
MSAEQFSDYIVFVDESGDHGMETIDPDYPLFVLAFCVMSKTVYVRQLTPAMQSVKFKLFGHDKIVLHERDIRKDSGDFSALKTRDMKAAFMDDLTEMVRATPFTLVCCIIRKDQLRRHHAEPGNPYHIALGFGLERVFYFLRSKGALDGRTHIIVEKRGKNRTRSWNWSVGGYAVETIASAPRCPSRWCFWIRKATHRDCNLPIWWRGLREYMKYARIRRIGLMTRCSESSIEMRAETFMVEG